MSGMANLEAEFGPRRITPEERDRRDLTHLRAEYGQDPEFMDALAVAWRLGFNRARQIGPQSPSALIVNPFWE